MVHGSVHGTPRCGLLTPSQSSPAGLNHNLLFLSLFFFFLEKKILSVCHFFLHSTMSSSSGDCCECGNGLLSIWIGM